MLGYANIEHWLGYSKFDDADFGLDDNDKEFILKQDGYKTHGYREPFDES